MSSKNESPLTKIARFENEYRKLMQGDVTVHTIKEIFDGIADLSTRTYAAKRLDEIGMEVKKELDKKSSLSVPIVSKKTRGRPRKEPKRQLVPIQFTLVLDNEKFILSGPINPPGSLSKSKKVEQIFSTHGWMNFIVNGKTVGVNANCTSFIN